MFFSFQKWAESMFTWSHAFCAQYVCSTQRLAAYGNQRKSLTTYRIKKIILCIIYSSLGSAVIWTDVIQFLLMITGVLGIIIVGFLSLTSVSDIWTTNDAGGRLIFFEWVVKTQTKLWCLSTFLTVMTIHLSSDLDGIISVDPSPFVRSSVWTVIFGLSVYYCAGQGASQSCIQKLLALENESAGRRFFHSIYLHQKIPCICEYIHNFRAIFLYGAGLVIFDVVALLIGLVIYANLYDCDPFTAGYVRKMDQVSDHIIRIHAYVYINVCGV